MGFAWWMDSSKISVPSFFKFLPRKYLRDLEYVSTSEKNMFEKQILESKNIPSKLSDHSEWIRLCELEKEQMLNSMLLCVEQCFRNSKELKVPRSQDLLSSEILEVLSRIVEVREKLIP